MRLLTLEGKITLWTYMYVRLWSYQILQLVEGTQWFLWKMAVSSLLGSEQMGSWVSKAPQTNLNLSLLKICPSRRFLKLRLVGIIHSLWLKVEIFMLVVMGLTVNWDWVTKNLRLNSPLSLRCKTSQLQASSQAEAILGSYLTTLIPPERSHLLKLSKLQWSAIFKKRQKVQLALHHTIITMCVQVHPIQTSQQTQDQLCQEN